MAVLSLYKAGIEKEDKFKVRFFCFFSTRHKQKYCYTILRVRKNLGGNLANKLEKRLRVINSLAVRKYLNI